MTSEHDVSSEHDEMTFNPAKQKWLFLMLTKFDKMMGKNPNEDDLDDFSYCAKDDVSDEEEDDDGLKYLGTESGIRRTVESVDVT